MGVIGIRRFRGPQRAEGVSVGAFAPGKRLDDPVVPIIQILVIELVPFSRLIHDLVDLAADKVIIILNGLVPRQSIRAMDELCLVADQRLVLLDQGADIAVHVVVVVSGRGPVLARVRRQGRIGYQRKPGRSRRPFAEIQLRYIRG